MISTPRQLSEIHRMQHELSAAGERVKSAMRTFGDLRLIDNRDWSGAPDTHDIRFFQEACEAEHKLRRSFADYLGEVFVGGST